MSVVGTLPYTGIRAGFLLAAGIVLLISGFALVRVAALRGRRALPGPRPRPAERTGDLVILTTLGTAILLVMGSYLLLTVVLSMIRPRAGAHEVAPLRVVFLIPALNEAKVIRNTVDSLLAVTERLLPHPRRRRRLGRRDG